MACHPDSLRDYQLELKTPGALAILAEQYEKIQILNDRVEKYTKGSKGMDSAAFDKLINQLKVFSNHLHSKILIQKPLKMVLLHLILKNVLLSHLI